MDGSSTFLFLPHTSLRRVQTVLSAIFLAAGVLPTSDPLVVQIPLRTTAPPACVFDTADATMSVPMIVSLATPQSLDSNPRARQQATTYLGSLLRHYERPAQLDVLVRPLVTIDQLGNDPDRTRLGLGGLLYIPVGPDGRLGKGRPAANSGLPAIDAALTSAVWRRDSVEPLPVGDWVRQAAPQPAHLSVIVSTGVPARAIPIAQSWVRIYKADSLVRPIRFERPKYPLAMQWRSEHAKVDLQYIVREDGKADSLSMRVVHVTVATNRAADPIADAFARSAVGAILASSFRPALVRGCPVPMLVLQRVTFSIGDTSPSGVRRDP